MTRSMTRWTAGLLTVAALGAVAVLDIGPSAAEAAPSTSLFAGTYDWDGLPVTISDGGRIAGSSSVDGEPGDYAFYVSVSGRTSVDGSYSFTRSTTIYTYDFFGRRHRVGKSSHASAGHMALNADGNIVATEDSGHSFVWLRQ